ncbi:hypothetical protein [Lichenifustis flavocetrariae]|uniref:Uncharacterized protein n=1 Tax=Lichenifustis flavocetrariae TaxID=2949735 RepID=A0AA41YT68_9HYPH|nr:hypothetical protein [Lichenifustis flavocetrariae]MCW6506870.1 hypothetical protein [Lichenifustis flavocetrariae]
MQFSLNNVTIITIAQDEIEDGRKSELTPSLTPTTSISLDRSFFGAKEQILLRHGPLSATLFRYDTGVEAIRIANARGSVTVLPISGR